MKIRLSEFRQVINKFISEAIEEMEAESVDRLRRAKDGYGETEFEEDLDRLRRSKDGYGETEFEEANMISKPQPQSAAKGSAALHTKDKSQMQGVGPRPNLANAFGDEKKEAVAPGAGGFEVRPVGPGKWGVWFNGEKQSVAFRSPDEAQRWVDIRLKKSGQGLEKKEDRELDPNKTAEIPMGQRPNSDEAEKQFMANQSAKKKEAEAERKKQNIEKIKNVHGPAGQQSLEKDGWKMTKMGGGNWSATPPKNR